MFRGKGNGPLPFSSSASVDSQVTELFGGSVVMSLPAFQIFVNFLRS